MPVRHQEPARSLIASWILRLGTAAALAIDAAVHAGSASTYDNVGTTLTQGTLFRAEAGVACAAALLVLVRPRPISWIIAFLVSAGALGAVMLYRYVDVGSLGPLPSMYENTWQVPGKLFSAYAEGAAVVLSALGLIVHRRWHADEHRGGFL
jgi:energy-converting hydrogenase Eha subunit C